MQSVYVCYEANNPGLARKAGTINELKTLFTKTSRDSWINARLKQAKKDDFIIDKEIGGPEKLAAMIEREDSIDIVCFRNKQENWDDSYDIVAQKMDIQI